MSTSWTGISGINREYPRIMDQKHHKTPINQGILAMRPPGVKRRLRTLGGPFLPKQ